VFGFAVYIGAHIADEGVVIVAVRVEGAEGGARNAREVAEFKDGGGYDSARIASTDEGIYLAFLDGLDADIDSRIGFLDDGPGGVFFHADDLRGRQDIHLSVESYAITGRFPLEKLGFPY
jgi:hypothetical protein